MEIQNRKANFDYNIVETYEAGIVLTGTEIKSIRAGKANIKDSYGIIKEDEMYILNMHIAHYEQGNRYNHEEVRTRKLLLHKSQIIKLKKDVERLGYTLIPLKVYLKRGRAKVLIGLGSGKKNYDKRQSIKEKDIKRDSQKELKELNR